VSEDEDVMGGRSEGEPEGSPERTPDPTASDPTASPQRPRGGRAHVRVVRPGGGNEAPPVPPIPPMPMTPPSVLPPWLAPPTPSAAADPVDADLGPEERRLRELLHSKVGGIQPAAGALESLRHAVPARQARRRRTYGGVVTAIALGVLGGAALHAVADSVDLAQGPQASQGIQNASTSSPAAGGGASASGSPIVPYLPGPGSGTTEEQSGYPQGGSQTTAPSGSRTGSSAPYTQLSPGSGSGSGAPQSAECSRGQLGDGSATVGLAVADGTVYGSFQVVNVSQSTCQVSETGTVAVAAVSGTNAAWISIAQHTASDPATLLPSPQPTPSPVVLAPGQSYVVDFAWVPASGAGAPSCTSSSPSSGASVTPTAGSADTGGTASGETVTTPISAPPSATPSSTQPTVTLVHIPGSGGAAAASVLLPDACAGTVYRTVPLAAG
jgi:hypothetical protein